MKTNTKMQYFLSKELHGQIQALRKRGGLFQKASNEISDIAIKISTRHENPFAKINLTHYGESRINKCIKYDLPGFVRLITIQDNGVCLLAFAGDKEECESWLNSKKGLNLAIDPKNKEMVEVLMSENINTPDKRISGYSDYSEGNLYKKLKTHYFYKIADLIKPSQLRVFLDFDSTMDDDNLISALDCISDQKLQTVFFDVFLCFRQGEVESAKNRILEFEESIKLVANAEMAEVESIVSNDEYLKINELEAEYLKTLLDTKDWYEWMLFLHPIQNTIVNQDFSGSARLLGVSGSGKTCVLVHRAVRLAEKYNGKKILILTLNKSLSKLIEKLIILLLSNTNKSHLKEFIVISSFWELCRDLLIKFDDKKTLAHRIFDIKTDKHGESVDEIWEEYYQCKLNNDDAKVLFPLHQNLLARGIFPQDYLKQEFDWIRSGFEIQNREKYFSIDREGRYVPFVEEDRGIVLDGLKHWERKMEDVGVIDHLGFANALYKHHLSIEPIYRSVLVDEVQDFGTMELSLIRMMVSEAENDLFICGDIAQQVYNKQHKIRLAGINILPEGFLKILKNYRNSREILEASYVMFKSNVNMDLLKNDDFEILNPEFANFSSPKPFIRRGISINQEFNSALEYLNGILDSNKKEKGCIAICGFSIFDISEIAKTHSLRVLDGEMDLSSGNVFISDLEQTKGFEFDRMIIINCNKNIIPNPILPKEESHREVSKLYVAMTRAKKDLIISYSRDISGLFEKCADFFTLDNWSDHIPQNNLKFELPDKLHLSLSKLDAAALDGRTLLYHKKAVGFSKDLQNKLIELVAGKNVTDERKKKSAG